MHKIDDAMHEALHRALHALHLDSGGGHAWRLTPLPLYGGGFLTALLQASLWDALGMSEAALRRHATSCPCHV